VPVSAATPNSYRSAKGKQPPCKKGQFFSNSSVASSNEGSREKKKFRKKSKIKKNIYPSEDKKNQRTTKQWKSVFHSILFCVRVAFCGASTTNCVPATAFFPHSWPQFGDEKRKLFAWFLVWKSGFIFRCHFWPS
jgi:hypothetical protein